MHLSPPQSKCNLISPKDELPTDRPWEGQTRSITLAATQKLGLCLLSTLASLAKQAGSRKA